MTKLSAATELEKDIEDVKAWLHNYAPQPLKTKMEGILRNRDQLIEVLWTYREVFGHQWKSGHPDSGCKTGCPGCAMERLLA